MGKEGKSESGNDKHKWTDGTKMRLIIDNNGRANDASPLLSFRFQSCLLNWLLDSIREWFDWFKPWWYRVNGENQVLKFEEKIFSILFQSQSNSKTPCGWIKSCWTPTESFFSCWFTFSISFFPKLPSHLCCLTLGPHHEKSVSLLNYDWKDGKIPFKLDLEARKLGQSHNKPLKVCLQQILKWNANNQKRRDFPHRINYHQREKQKKSPTVVEENKKIKSQ